MQNLLLCLLFLFTKPIFSQDIIILEFNEPMDTLNLYDKNNYVITCQEPYMNMGSTPIIRAIFKPAGLPLDSLVYVYVYTDEHLCGDYRIEIFNVCDLAGNYINLSHNYSIYTAGSEPVLAADNPNK